MMAPPSDRQVYRMTLKVTREHIDDLDHVNNVVYLSWVQDVADAHWKGAASSRLRGECRWVVLKHLIEYHHAAVEGDEIELLTWVDEATGVRQVRHVSVQRASDNKVLAYAETTWCLLDPVSGKPKRIGAEIETALRALPKSKGT